MLRRLYKAQNGREGERRQCDDIIAKAGGAIRMREQNGK